MLIRDPKLLFLVPSDENTVWRYTHLDQLEAIIRKRSLGARRLDTFPNASELTTEFPNMIKLLNSLSSKNHINPSGPLLKVSQLPDRFRAEYIFEDTKRRLYVSSWHLSNCEDPFMWKEYSAGSDGLIIRSSVGKLKNLNAKPIDGLDHLVKGNAARMVNYDLEMVDLEFSFDLESESIHLFPNWYRHSPFIKKYDFRMEKEFRVPLLVGTTQEVFGNSFFEAPAMSAGEFGTYLPLGWPFNLQLPLERWKKRPEFVEFDLDPEILIDAIYISRFQRELRVKIENLFAESNLEIPIKYVSLEGF